MLKTMKKHIRSFPLPISKSISESFKLNFRFPIDNKTIFFISFVYFISTGCCHLLQFRLNSGNRPMLVFHRNRIS